MAIFKVCISEPKVYLDNPLVRTDDEFDRRTMAIMCEIVEQEGTTMQQDGDGSLSIKDGSGREVFRREAGQWCWCADNPGPRKTPRILGRFKMRRRFKGS